MSLFELRHLCIVWILVGLHASSSVEAMQLNADVVQPASAEPGQSTVFGLSRIDAEKALEIIRPLFIRGQTRMAVMPQSNSIVLVGPEFELITITELLRNLDQDAKSTVNLSTLGSTSSDVVVLQTKVSDKSVDVLQAEYQALELECHQLAKQILDSKSEQSPDRTKLAELVGRTFDVRQQLQLAQVTASARRLDRIQQTIAMREGIRGQIIERRMKELMNAKPDTSTGTAMGSMLDTNKTQTTKPTTNPGEKTQTSDQEESELKVHEVVGVDPELALRILTQRLAGELDVRMELDKNKLFVQARPGIQQAVERLLAILGSPSPKLEAIELKKLDVDFALAATQKFYGLSDRDRADLTQPIVDGDPINRRLFVKGSAKQIEQIRSFIETLESNTSRTDNAPATSPLATPVDTMSQKPSSVATTNSLGVALPMSNASVSESDLLRTSPAEIRKSLYDKAQEVIGIRQSIENVQAAIRDKSQSPTRLDELNNQLNSYQKMQKFKEGEFQFAVLQYEQTMEYLRFVEADIQRKIASGREAFHVAELLFQRGSATKLEVESARQKTHEFDVDLRRVESLLKLYEAAGDIPGLAQAKQMIAEENDKKPDVKE